MSADQPACGRYVRIVAEVDDNADGFVRYAHLVTVSPWPGLPTPFMDDTVGYVMWQCCADGPVALVSKVILHLPAEATDPAFTVEIYMDIPGIDHLLGKHGFSPA